MLFPQPKINYFYYKLYIAKYLYVHPIITFKKKFKKIKLLNGSEEQNKVKMTTTEHTVGNLCAKILKV